MNSAGIFIVELRTYNSACNTTLYVRMSDTIGHSDTWLPGGIPLCLHPASVRFFTAEDAAAFVLSTDLATYSARVIPIAEMTDPIAQLAAASHRDPARWR